METDEVKQELYKVGYASIDKFIDAIVMRLNEFDASLKLKEISFHYLSDTDKYIGLILDEQLNKSITCVLFLQSWGLVVAFDSASVWVCIKFDFV